MSSVIDRSILLAQDLDRLILDQVAHGRYDHADDAVRDSLRLLQRKFLDSRLQGSVPQTAILHKALATDHPQSAGLDGSWPQGGGTMGSLIRGLDWTRTSLGPIDIPRIRENSGIRFTTVLNFDSIRLWGRIF
jgi:Arc/MetJ-type ribon-helix-helix transcriptional regulator